MPVTPDVRTWAIRHGVTELALIELAEMIGSDARPAGASSEGRVQSEIRLAAPALGMRLFRNNVGVLTNEDGVPVRYGLANDSKQLNSKLKSSDLIGWRKRVVGPELVGSTIAQFVAVECKAAGWSYTGSAREQAQNRFLTLVASEGGYARFANSVSALDDSVK